MKWEGFRESVETASGEWVIYDANCKNAHSAQSLASQLRKRFPHLEIRTNAGVIRGRLREVSNDAA